MILQTASDLEPTLIVIWFIILIGLNVYCYQKFNKFWIMFFIGIMSIFFGINALSYNIPLAPYIQYFFIVFQILILITSFFKRK